MQNNPIRDFSVFNGIGDFKEVGFLWGASFIFGFAFSLVLI